MTTDMAIQTSTLDAALLEIDQASVVLGDRWVLDRVSLRIDAGQHTAILGPNGSGKSTLVKLVARQLHPLARGGRAGAVRIFGQERWNVAALRSRLGIVSPAVQLDYTTDTPLEVLDAVVSGFHAARGVARHHVVTAAMHKRAREALEQVGAESLMGRWMQTLSTGEARRVVIARALVHRPRALLLDEPCAGLDMASRRQFMESMRALAVRWYDLAAGYPSCRGDHSGDRSCHPPARWTGVSPRPQEGHAYRCRAVGDFR